MFVFGRDGQYSLFTKKINGKSFLKTAFCFEHNYSNKDINLASVFPPENASSDVPGRGRTVATSDFMKCGKVLNETL